MAEFFKAAVHCDINAVSNTPLPLDVEDARHARFLHERLLAQLADARYVVDTAGLTRGAAQLTGASGGATTPAYEPPGAVATDRDPALRKIGPHAQHRALRQRMADAETQLRAGMADLQERETEEAVVDARRRAVESAAASHRSHVAAQQTATAGGATTSSNTGVANLSMADILGPTNAGSAAASAAGAAGVSSVTISSPVGNSGQHASVVLRGPFVPMVAALGPADPPARRPHPVDVLHARVAADLRTEVEQFEAAERHALGLSRRGAQELAVAGGKDSEIILHSRRL
jgi:hypothetical protein